MFPPLALNAWMRWDAIERAFAVVPTGARVLEVGAGQGSVGARLAARYAYTGCEPDGDSAQVARARVERYGGRLVAGYDRDLSATERFNVVCAFEVLEHIEDDLATLRAWTSRLTSDGWLILSVPAFQRRFAAADRMAGHFRRYDPGILRDRLIAAGLRDPEVWVTGFPFGLLLEQGRNLLAAIRPKPSPIHVRTLESGRWHQPGPWLGLVTAGVTLPFRYLQRPFAHLSWGTGLVARARRF